MILHFVRHGETDYNKTKTITGWTDISINETGRAQAHTLASKLPKSLSLIYCSDLLRARETCAILNESLQLPVCFTPHLRERCFGSLQGKTWPEIQSLYPQAHLYEHDRLMQYDYRPFGGEAVADVRHRLQLFLDEVCAHHTGEILAVTSSGIIREMLQIHGRYIPEEEVTNAGVYSFEVK